MRVYPTRLSVYRTRRDVYGYGYSRRGDRWFIRYGRWVLTNKAEKLKADWFRRKRR